MTLDLVARTVKVYHELLEQHCSNNYTHPAAARFVDQRLKIERRGGDQRRDSLGIWTWFTKNVKSYQNCIVPIMIPITHPAARLVDQRLKIERRGGQRRGRLPVDLDLVCKKKLSFIITTLF